MLINPTDFWISENQVRRWLDHSRVAVLFPYLSRVVGWEPSRLVDCKRYRNEEGKPTKIGWSKQIWKVNQESLPQVREQSVLTGNGTPRWVCWCFLSGTAGLRTAIMSSRSVTLLTSGSWIDAWLVSWERGQVVHPWLLHFQLAT